MAIIYTGVFFDANTEEKLRELSNGGLERPTERLHSTVKFRPINPHTELFGERVKVEVTGYGINSENEGLSCICTSENPELQKLLDEVEVPHITLSVSKNGKAVNTRYVEFNEPRSFVCYGYFDGFK